MGRRFQKDFGELVIVSKVLTHIQPGRICAGGKLSKLDNPNIIQAPLPGPTCLGRFAGSCDATLRRLERETA